jgi:hypothetical protein
MGAVKALNMIDSIPDVGEFADLETFALPHTSVKSELENTSWELVQIFEIVAKAFKARLQNLCYSSLKELKHNMYDKLNPQEEIKRKSLQGIHKSETTPKIIS